MRKILNNAPSMSISTNRSPLTVNLSIDVAAGTLTQAQDKMKHIWNPDRTLKGTLILNPIFTAYNPDTKTNVSAESGRAWYRRVFSNDGSAYTDTIITSTTPSDDYYKETTTGNVETGRLVIRKNVDYTTPEFIVCKVQYTDNVSSSTYEVEAMVTLTTENKPDEFYSVKIQESTTVTFSPLTDATSTKTIRAVAMLGNSLLDWNNVVGGSVGAVDLGTLTWSKSDTIFSASLPSSPLTSGGAVAAGYTQDQSLASDLTLSTSTGGIRIKDSNYSTASAFKAAMGGRILFYELSAKTVDKGFIESMQLLTTYFWYCDDELISTDGSFPAYISGQGSDSLTVDMDYLDGKTISVEIGMPVFTDNEGVISVSLPLTTNTPARDMVLIAWDWGHLDALPVARGGSSVREKTLSKTFDARVRKDNVDVVDAKVQEYIRLNWKAHSTDANYGTTTDHGWGKTTIIEASTLRKTGNISSEVNVDIYTLGELALLTDDSPGGSGYVTDDNGEYIVGRT